MPQTVISNGTSRSDASTMVSDSLSKVSRPCVHGDEIVCHSPPVVEPTRRLQERSSHLDLVPTLVPAIATGLKPYRSGEEPRSKLRGLDSTTSSERNKLQDIIPRASQPLPLR